MARRGLDERSAPGQRFAVTDQHLRDAPGLVETRAGGSESPLVLSRARRSAGRAHEAFGLHACRVSATHGASVLRFLGLPGNQFLRADLALWLTDRLHVP